MLSPDWNERLTSDLIFRTRDTTALKGHRGESRRAMRTDPLAHIKAVDALDFVMKDGVGYRDDDRRLETDCPDFWAPGRAGGFY